MREKAEKRDLPMMSWMRAAARRNLRRRNDCRAEELKLQFSRQPKIRIPFEGQVSDRYYRPDYVIENEVVLEVKSIKNFLPVHDAQILTYMRMANVPKGLLINFNVAILVHGIRRFILTKAPPGASDM